MSAIRKTGAPGAAAAAVGAFVILLAVAMLTLGGASASAAAATRHTRTHHSDAGRRHRHVRPRHRRRHRRVAVKRAIAMIPAVASWYYDEGNTACGFHAEYGVANKTLPCGTKVRLSYEGRTVLATVDDRGPFVYGRTFDLDQRTAAALGMWGVATVLCSQI